MEDLRILMHVLKSVRKVVIFFYNTASFTCVIKHISQYA